MSEKARRLGIPERDIVRALTLVRDFRVQVLGEALDSRATRIALIYANLVDYHFVRQRLSLEELAALEEIAGEYFRMARQRT